jgi:hypothetical protein
MVGESKGTETAGGGRKRWQRGRARAKLEEGDDRWGPPISLAWRGAKAT